MEEMTPGNVALSRIVVWSGTRTSAKYDGHCSLYLILAHYILSKASRKAKRTVGLKVRAQLEMTTYSICASISPSIPVFAASAPPLMDEYRSSCVDA